MRDFWEGFFEMFWKMRYFNFMAYLIILGVILWRYL